ncbi:hypothetical protein BGW36DRAFT_355794 [Talaromyces proteolyticus]|uniref:Uncharacterized protein n=1 Tax=Talaromyces proteolyticus TaxID=1131652 RepID=A0AAD4KWJ3_9EURO|nr:uncharacterized protein BGW36DRAFT_355794 [Talaromyces proteolyticus]KAH8701641.1 hypothetical protein BGW36DRAFT_355794 [Talaromyces proteolyticus]
MFENFSFPSPSTVEGDDRLMPECDSTMISPLSSRSPSPSCISRRSRPLSRPRSPYYRPRPQAPTSMPLNYEPYPRRISVGTLTEKLNAHSLEQTTRPAPVYEHPPLSPLSPTSTTFSTDSISTRGNSAYTVLTSPGDYDDEGYDEPMALRWERLSHSSARLSSPTSAPSQQDLFLPEELPSRVHRQPCMRLQRQRFSRAQCSIDAVRIALMAEASSRRTSESEALPGEDCHPSSLPPDVSPNRPRVPNKQQYRVVSSGLRSRERTPPDHGMRRRSTSATTFASTTRIAKPRARDLHSKKSEQTLRRKSLVSAALASMMYDTPSSRSPSP